MSSTSQAWYARILQAWSRHGGQHVKVMSRDIAPGICSGHTGLSDSQAQVSPSEHSISGNCHRRRGGPFLPSGATQAAAIRSSSLVAKLKAPSRKQQSARDAAWIRWRAPLEDGSAPTSPCTKPAAFGPWVETWTSSAVCRRQADAVAWSQRVEPRIMLLDCQKQPVKEPFRRVSTFCRTTGLGLSGSRIQPHGRQHPPLRTAYPQTQS